MPITLVGTVEPNLNDWGTLNLIGANDSDVISTMLARYEGKKIRMRVSIQEVIG